MFLGIIFFLELTAGVLAFVFKDWIKDQLYFFINNNIRAYRDDIDLQNLIDFTQEYVSASALPLPWKRLLARGTPIMPCVSLPARAVRLTLRPRFWLFASVRVSLAPRFTFVSHTDTFCFHLFQLG